MLPLYFTPTGYEVCVDESEAGRLVSFSIEYANENENEQWKLPRIGPEGGECKLISKESREFPLFI